MTDILQQPLNVIKGLFPNVKEDTIHSILQKYHYDLLNTFFILDRLESESYDYFDQPDDGDEIGGIRRKDICIYDVQGVCQDKHCKYQHVNAPLPYPNACKYTLYSCHVSNCPYRHSAGTIICKHWLLGNCANTKCTYSHQFEDTLNMIEDYFNNLQNGDDDQYENNNNNNNNNISTINSTSNKQQKPPQQTEDDFPELGNIKKPTTQFKKPAGKRKKNKQTTTPTSPTVTTTTTTTSTTTVQKTTTTTTTTPPTKHTITIVEEQRVTTNNSTPATSVEDNEFPSLSSLSVSSKQKPKIKRMTYQIDGSAFVQIQNLKNLFSKVDENTIHKEFIVNNNQNYDGTYESLVKKYGKPTAIQLNTVSSPIVTGRKSKHYSVFDHNSYNKLWAETGVDVSLLYTQHRETAILHARERNRLFNQAARAYTGHAITEAREYSNKAREHDAIMKEYNDRARDIIFKTRNKDYDPINNNVLDFHGLHVFEALEILEDHLNNLPLKIIIGTGHHSLTPSARLPTKIKEYLTNNNFGFKDISTDKRGGLLLIFK